MVWIKYKREDSCSPFGSYSRVNVAPGTDERAAAEYAIDNIVESDVFRREDLEIVEHPPAEFLQFELENAAALIKEMFELQEMYTAELCEIYKYRDDKDVQ